MTFEKMIGQDAAKDKLQFYLEARKKTGIFPHTIFMAAKGTGKSYMGELLGEALEKQYVHINAGAIPSLKALVEQFFEPMEDKNWTLFIDEIHRLKSKPAVVDALLTILDTKSSYRNVFTYEDREIVFDSHKFTFIASTTEKQLVFEPLLDRLKPITLVAYTPEEIGKILRFHTPNVIMTQEAVDFILPYCRGNARQAWHIAGDIRDFVLVNELPVFDYDAAFAMTRRLAMFEFGLTGEEFRVLQVIAQEPKGLTLTSLCARTDYTKASQQDMEKFLLRLGLMSNDNSLRKVTQKGREYIARNMELWNKKRTVKPVDEKEAQ
jgi:Holliday junction resolvasome RuvABC ATP-dependent DNA helicase subunit